MASSGYQQGRTFLFCPRHKSELVRSVLDFAKERKIKMAVFTVVGAVKEAGIAYYNQAKREYQKIQLDKPLEIASGFGNLSIKDEKPFAHIHVVLSDATGRAYGGHLIRALVFAAEVYIRELRGKELEREYDQTTGLALWKFEG